MRTNISNHFVELANEIRVYRASVDGAMSRYRKAKADAIENLNERKLPIKVEQLKEIARGELYAAYSKLKNNWSKCYEPLLREAIIEHIRQAPPKEAMERLAIYRDFDIPLTRTDVSYFLHELAGTHVGSCALAAVAAKHGITVKVPSIEQLENDIETLNGEIYRAERYVCREFSSEWKEVSPEIKNVLPGDDPFNPRNMTAAFVAAENVFPHINEIMQRWSASFVPELINNEEMTGDEREQVKQEHAEALKAAAEHIKIDDDADIRLGARMGKQRAEAAERAKAAVDAYV